MATARPSCYWPRPNLADFSKQVELALFFDAKLDVAAMGMKAELILKRASASRPSGQWSEDDFDVLSEGAVVGRIFKVRAAPAGTP